MMEIRKPLAFLTAFLFVLQPLGVMAGPAARLIPFGSVKLMGNGVVVESQVPVPEGSLMVCSGKCIVQSARLQLVAADQAVFAVKEDPSQWSILVRKGTIDFSFCLDAKPVAFQTPFKGITTQPFLAPASTDSVIRGTFKVAGDKAILSLDRGALRVASAEGESVVNAHESIVLTQAEIRKGTGGGMEDASGPTIGKKTLLLVGSTLALAGVVALAVGGGGGGRHVVTEASPF